jgi:AraC-like DNA-binding protein
MVYGIDTDRLGMRSFPIISAEHVIRIAKLLDAVGVRADRYLEQARISPRVCEGFTEFLPGRSVWAMVDATDRGEALGEFWLDIARVAEWQRAGWVPPMTHAATLGDAIRAMCSSYARQIPMNELGLSVEGPVAWFWRQRVADVRGWPGSEPAEQYTLSFMLEVVRAAAGPTWLPECLKVECSPSGWSAATSRLPGVRFDHDRPLLALAIPVQLLCIPVSIRALPGAERGRQPAATDFQGSLRQVLEPWLATGLPSQEVAAEMLGTPPRTLRRRLAEEGTSWHTIVSDLKFARAVTRLQEERSSVREVAEELGYSVPAHFSRFFRHRAGVPPGAYRERIERARELARRPLSGL